MSLSERRALHAGIERRSTAVLRLVDDYGYSSRGVGAPSVSGWKLSAHAAVTGVSYTVRDKFGFFTEHLHPGSFRDTLAKGADVHLLVNHAGMSLARTRSGTLTLAEDARGLAYEADLDPSNPVAQALRSAVERGDIDQSSFSFQPVREQWSADYLRRDLYQVSIDHGDVSPVNFGANSATGDPGLAATLRGERRAELSSQQMNNLPDTAFAYIQPGGRIDSSGRTVPRTYRHFLIHDAAHVRNALARIAQGAAFGDKAMPAVLRAAKKFGIQVSQANAEATLLELRSPLHHKFLGTHTHSHPAFGSQGGDKSHSHEHTHSGDADHSHHGDSLADVADADTVSDSIDDPSSLSEAIDDYEIRVRILRLTTPCQGSTVRQREQAQWDAADESLQRRIRALRGYR